MADDDDEPRLSASTLKALEEFLAQQSNSESPKISENWQLSQFWYDDSTANVLSNAALAMAQEENSKIALVSCPTLYPAIKSKLEKFSNIELRLFEYDTRFNRFGSDFVFYDYNEPLKFDEKYKSCFDVVVIDPPFLSEECLTKVSKTVVDIKKKNGKIILCTGAVMEELATKLLNVRRCCFEPKHHSNLGNEFICMTNFGELPC